MRQPSALITGTSRGLGQSMALTLISEGYKVYGLSRTKSSIIDPNFVDIECDIRDESSVEEMYQILSEDIQKLDLIVLNAGIFQMSPLAETSTKEFQDQLQTNVVGAYHILKHSLDFLIENQTHVITISSIAGMVGLPNVAAYSASKFALKGMIESVKKEWMNMGIRFSTIFPGAIDTTIWDDLDTEFDRKDMLSVDEFMYLFGMVINAPLNMQFPELVVTHKSGIIE